MQNSDFPNLSKSWQVKTLGEVCEKISAGGDRPNDCTAEKTQENQIPLFSNGIENNGLYGYTKTPTITKPALTISARGTIGFVCVRYEPFFPIVRLICAIPNDKVLVLEFLAYALRYLIPQGEGSSIPQLTIPNFKQIKIPIPPLEIQRRIVKRLDEAFSRIENGTKHLKSAKDNLTKYKQSLLKSAFNGTLTQDCPLSQGESTAESSLRENPQGFSWQSTHSLSQGESANLPQGWTIKTLGEIAHTTSGGTPSRKNLDYWNGNIKWLKSGELNDDYINEVEESITQIGLDKSSAKIFPKGTLLIALYGATIGKLGILNIETATNQAICAITPNKDFEVKYLFHFLFSIRDKMIQDAFGGAQSNISQTYLKQLKIPIPPLEIQKQIVAILERHFTSADKVSAYIESCLSKAKQLKSSLLKSAFAGELV